MVSALLCVLCALPATAIGEEPKQPPNCQTDAMLVFDASGSMAGMGFGEKPVTRIEQVRRALATVLPSVAPVRNLGLITFGPGTRRECDNIQLRFRPIPNAAERILDAVDSLQPYGQTPITKAVSEAAEAMNFRSKPAVIVLLTDGEETCGGNLCGLAQKLKAEGAGVTVHVIGYMLSLANAPASGQFVSCLSEATGGLFLSTTTTAELISALRQTLGCPVMSSAPGPHPSG
jgi:Ca-activated chloride channel family protein